MAQVSFIYRLPNMLSLLNLVPEENRPRDDQLALFWQIVARELAELIRYAASAKQPEICFSEGRQGGEQYLWEFWVNDLSSPVQNQYNFHGQNTSQWLYAGGIVLQNGRVSAHH
ncbi:MAG TPA: hypothetical protein VMW64_00930 [Dehalococcoidia bacterium]|nr:hypothetical protein [Dehalococcoidia bacterium]